MSKVVQRIENSRLDIKNVAKTIFSGILFNIIKKYKISDITEKDIIQKIGICQSSITKFKKYTRVYVFD